jgi:hypothetical protein
MAAPGQPKVPPKPSGPPYPLNRATIDAVVTTNDHGVYVLGGVDRGGKLYPLLVGRSHNRPLRERIKDHVGDPTYADCTHFIFAYRKDASEVFDSECTLWHNARTTLTHNTNHPERPDGKNCPVAGCPKARSIKPR